MAEVRLRYRGPLARLVGKDGEAVRARSVRQALAGIRLRHGRAAYSQAKRMLVAVNATSITLLAGYSTPLVDGDEVAFLPICGGG